MKQSNLLVRIGKRLISNLGIKLVSILFACIVWLIATNQHDPVIAVSFNNIQVVFHNEEIITNDGKVFKPLDDTDVITVIVRARRSVHENISERNITAVADISQMEQNSIVPITVSVQGYTGRVETVEASHANVHIQIEDVDRATFPLTIRVEGEPAGGFVLGDLSVSPETVTVSGPETLVRSIQKAVAQVDVSGLRSTREVSAELIIYNHDDDVVNQMPLTIGAGENGIMVAIEIKDTTSLPVVFEESDDVPEGYVITNISAEPSYILVAGLTEVLDEVTEVEIPFSALEIVGEVGTREMLIDIREFLPEGISLVDENANIIVVSLTIDQIGTRTIELPVDAISITHLAYNLIVSFGTVEMVELTFSGEQRVLNDLNIQNAVSIDLRAFNAPGTVHVILDVDIPPGVQIIRSPSIRVILEER